MKSSHKLPILAIGTGTDTTGTGSDNPPGTSVRLLPAMHDGDDCTTGTGTDTTGTGTDNPPGTSVRSLPLWAARTNQFIDSLNHAFELEVQGLGSRTEPLAKKGGAP